MALFRNKTILIQLSLLSGLLLAACTQGGISGTGGGPGGSGVGENPVQFQGQADPSRGVALEGSNPQEDCSEYVRNPFDYEPEEVRENCLDWYNMARENYAERIPDEPVILEREPPKVIDGLVGEDGNENDDSFQGIPFEQVDLNRLDQDLFELNADRELIRE